jgi:hypothetical protein
MDAAGFPSGVLAVRSNNYLLEQFKKRNIQAHSSVRGNSRLGTSDDLPARC